jgi:hypothetical protein
VVIDYAQEMLELGHRTGRREAILSGERVAGSAYLLLGRLNEARTAYEHLLALYEKDKDGCAGIGDRTRPIGCWLFVPGHLSHFDG